MAAAWYLSNCEEIPHIQGQRNPSKMVGTGAAAVWCWSNFEEMSHIQGQRRSPSKMVGEVKSHLESNSIPARDAQRAQIYLVCTRTQTPTETEPELCLSVSCGGTCQQWTAAGEGALGAVDLCVA